MPSAQRKAVARPTKKAQPVSPWDGALDEGDLIEFSITAEVKNRQGRSFWVKGGATGRVRPGEGVENARARIQSFVIDTVDQQITEYVGN